MPTWSVSRAAQDTPPSLLRATEPEGPPSGRRLGAGAHADGPMVDAFQRGALRWVGSWDLIAQLASKDLKLKYRGSVFGFLWSLINPLVMLGVYAFAFSVVLQIRSEGFVFFLFTGLLPWTFFAGSAGMSTGAIVDRASFVKSATFPRGILPVATVLFNLAQYLLTIVVLYPVMLVAFGHAPALPLVVFPLIVALHVTFTVGVAFLLATGTVFFRDIRHLLEIVLSALFWTTPIIYDLSIVPERLQPLLQWSPAAPFILATRDVLYYGRWPSLTLWAACAVYAAAAFAVGTRVFAAYEDRFAERV